MSAARTIWKFPILSTGPMSIEVPDGGKPALVGRDPATGLLALWVDLDPAAGLRPRYLQVVGTGRPIPDGAQHLGSAILGELVWHLFELPTP